MKILWFTGGTSLYANKNTYNGGGWVASFQQALINNPNTDVVIEVAFPWHCNMQDNVDGVVYYGIKRMLKPFICYNRKQKAEYERRDKEKGQDSSYTSSKKHTKVTSANR